ncbi:MAG: universal stress protein [Bacillota bacterium]
MFHKILLVLDASLDNSRTISLAMGLARSGGASLTALCITGPEGGSVLGDEWISCQRALDRFFRYMKEEKDREALQLLDQVRRKGHEHGLYVDTIHETGDHGCIIQSIFSNYRPFDVVVLPGKMPLDIKKLLRKLPCPLFITPEKKV